MLPLFVYGSLLAGERNHTVLEGAEALGPAATRAGEFELVDLGAYPAIVKGRGPSVVGELYRVSDPLLARLDRFEGVPRLYQRVAVEVATVRGERARAYAYVMRQRRAAGLPRVASGSWRERASGRRVALGEVC